MLELHNIERLRHQIQTWRNQGLRSALVPTMGALHEGHLELVRAGIRIADRVVVTVFVNPKQFGPNEDLATYPRDLAGDMALLEKAGVHLVYVPATDDMYPAGFSTTVTLAGPAKAGLEDRFRPHFFDGVATIVAKLFNQAGCDYAMFGEKDYQQLMVVKQMARDLNLLTSVIGVETVRNANGLALSSRNAYLSEKDHKTAESLNRCLNDVAANLRAGMAVDKAIASGQAFLAEKGFKVDYLEARHANNLEKIADRSEPIRLLAAAWLGKTRLIDNIAV